MTKTKNISLKKFYKIYNALSEVEKHYHNFIEREIRKHGDNFIEFFSITDNGEYLSLRVKEHYSESKDEGNFYLKGDEIE